MRTRGASFGFATNFNQLAIDSAYPTNRRSQLLSQSSQPEEETQGVSCEHAM